MDPAESIVSASPHAVVEGGPGAALLARLHRKKADGNLSGASNLIWSGIMLALISWVPLLVLSLVEGVALNGPKIPFFHDIAAQVRSLIAIPLLIIAEIPVGSSTRTAAGRFLTTHLVREKDLDRFDEIFADTLRRRDSKIAEIVILLIVYLGSFLVVFKAPFQAGSTWFRPESAGLSLAGYWYVLIVIPVFQFLVYRWLYRLLLWFRCLRALAKLDLALVPTHPDRAGGLGFLSQSLPAFGVLLFAVSSVASATLANRILFDGEKLADYQYGFAVLIVVLMLFFASPLLVFTPKLLALKENGLHQYGELASSYNQAFQSKWLESAASRDERLLGTGDLQSQAALESSFQVVREIRPVPIELGDLMSMIVPGILPGLPLILTIMPASLLLKAVLKLAQTAA